jgi:immune inhibitor A
MSPTQGRSHRHAGLFVAIVAAVLFAAPVAGAMPPSPALLERAAHDSALAGRISAFTQHVVATGIDAPRGEPVMMPLARGVMRPRVQRAAPATGTLRTIALVVDFSDRVHSVAASAFDDLLFADVYGPASVRGYFREISYGSPTTRGLLDIVTVDPPSSTGWLRLPQALAYYTAGGRNGRGTYPNNAQRMVEDAVAAADPFIDFRQYDSDGDGFVDNLCVIHAGQGAEHTGDASHVWSHKWQTKSPISVDGVAVSSYSTEPEYWSTPGDMTTGVFCHEMGHILGLPDLYDRDKSSAGIGRWSLMASGSWNGKLGSSPSRLDAWCSAQLGWLKPQVLEGRPAMQSIPDVASGRSATAFKLYPRGATSGSEYFLVENRQRTGTDAALPGAGLLIWHVDEARNRRDVGYQNDTESHKLVDLEEAAGEQSLDLDWKARSTADDPYPGTSGNRRFSDATNPNANTYANSDSKVVIDHISDSSAVMTARMGFGATPPLVTAFTPASGPAGTAVTLTGTGFSGATAIAFNGTAASAFTAVSDTEITATVPRGASSGPITVTTRAGTGTSVASFFVIPAPTVTVFLPTSGPVGTSVTVTGSALASASVVAFNGTPATFTVDSDAQITTSVPAGCASGPISVTTGGGTASSAEGFTVLATPTVTLKLNGLKSGVVKLGARVTATGQVTPIGLAGAAVTLTAQIKKGARWLDASTASPGIGQTTGTYRWTYKPAKKGTYRVHATIAESATNEAAATPWLRFMVK